MKMLLCKIYKFTNPEGNCNGLKCQCRLLMCSESRKMSKTSDENAMTETSTGAKILMPAILENLKKKLAVPQYNILPLITLLCCQRRFHKIGSHANCMLE